MKRINFTTLILLIYLIVMAVVGWPGKQAEPNYVEFFIIIGVSIAVIFLLRYVQIKRLRIRKDIREKKEV